MTGKSKVHQAMMADRLRAARDLVGRGNDHNQINPSYVDELARRLEQSTNGPLPAKDPNVFAKRGGGR